MKVYFNHNFWSKQGIGIPGIPKPAGWKFTYDDAEYFISKIYQFPEGVTMDIINIFNDEKFKIFYDKYALIEYEMNEEEILIAEQERPIPELPLHNVYINNQPTEINTSSLSYISFLNYRQDKNVLTEIRKEYGLSDEQSFQCIRVHAKYLDESQKEIRQMKFLTLRTEELMPVKKRFKVENKASGYQYDIVFQHPMTGEEHKLYIEEVEFRDNRLVFTNYDQNVPYKNVMLKYELVPSLPKDERIIIHEIKQADIKDRIDAGTVGYIGYNNEKGRNGYPIEYAFSDVYWKTLDFAEFSIVGIYKIKCKEKEIDVFNKES